MIEPGTIGEAGREMDPARQDKLAALRGKKMVRVRIQSPSDKDDDPQRRLMWGDYWVKYELTRALESLGCTVADHDPDVIVHFFGFPPKKPLPRETYNLVWLYSQPDLATRDHLQSFDRIFCASPGFAVKLRNQGLTDIELMPPCTAKRPVTVPLRHDLIFLGNARTRRRDGRKVVADLLQTGRPFKVWGNLWDQLLPADHIGGRYWDYRDIETLYASARITLTDHLSGMARGGFVSNKIFDVLAGGGFAISDINPGLTEMFGPTIPQYESPEHLADLIDLYLGRPDQRQDLMHAGRKIALAHTYLDRARQIVRDFRPVAHFGAQP